MDANATPLEFSRTISAPPSTSTIYILINHNHDAAVSGGNYPLPAGTVVSGIGECDFDDNFFTLNAVSSSPNVGLTVQTSQSTICSGQSTVIQVLNSESGINYQLRDASDNNVGNPVAGNGGTIELNSGNLTANTTFTVWATPTGTSCSLALTDTQVITVQSAPNLSLALETTNNNLCTGSDATITIKNAENGISYQASLGGNAVGTAATGTGADLDLTIPAASLSVGANNVMITATNPSICTLNLSNTLTINVANPPSSDRQFDTQVCVDSGQPASISIADSELGVSYQLRNNADNSAVGTAVAGTGESITLSSDPLTGPATFNILATGTGACNQSVSLNATIEASINELSLSIAASQDTIFGGEEATIIATSGATNYTWTTRVERTNLPQDESIISGNNTSTINVAPVEDTWYIVTASDDKACSRTDSVLVAVRFEIFIPSLFSPNSDGNNDAFTIKTQSSSIQDLDFRVFDRAGNLVYETQDAVEATTTGWDGKNNGREQPISNYIWVVDGTFLNGQPIEYQGKNRGEINLIR